MMSTPWKVTVGTLAAVAVVSGSYIATLAVGGPGPFSPVTLGQPVATPGSPASATPVLADSAPKPKAGETSAKSARSAAKPAKSKPKSSAPHKVASASSASASSVSAESAD